MATASRLGAGILTALLFAGSAGAQDVSGGWIPLGPVPVDQAGAGRRGYVLPAEGADVMSAGAQNLSTHIVAANNFYREQTAGFLVSQRAETHTLAIGYRRGLKLWYFPRLEIGGQVQFHQVDGGELNGFITGFESVWSTVTTVSRSSTYLRASVVPPPQGTFVARDGSAVYRDAGKGYGLGDVSLTAKTVLLDGDPASKAVRIAARIGINIAGATEFSAGNFVGAGLSVDRKLFDSVAFHGDVRAARLLDRLSPMTLPLKRMTYGFSFGPELNLPKENSFSVQIDGSSTPYLPTGTLAFDAAYGDITFSLGHRYKAGTRTATMQVYARENMNLPFDLGWNIDPDLAVGVKISIR